MDYLWSILIQFIFRVTLGMALAMGVTPPKLVTSGFYRVHLWVLMGLNTVAALAAYANRDSSAAQNLFGRFGDAVVGLAVAAAVVSYLGSVVWLYARRRAGRVMLWALALVGLIAAACATNWQPTTTGFGVTLVFLDLISSGLLLGSTLAAMLLGHWYLNTPTMELAPLKRLLLLMVAAIALRTVLCALGLGLQLSTGGSMNTNFGIFLALRWLSGLLGTFMLALLAWNTLKIPNTQSATGILYAGVILAFIGELTSQLLSVGEAYPV